MTTTPPPFDPPYTTVYPTEEGVRYVETLADGTTRPISSAAVGSIWPCTGNAGSVNAEANGQAPRRSGDAAAKSRQSQGGNGKAAVFLKVPFADKDAAKSLGARWDPKQKKWYVPHGGDVDAFRRWWPDALAEGS